MTACNNCGRKFPEGKTVRCFCTGSVLFSVDQASTPQQEPMNITNCIKCNAEHPGPSGVCQKCRIEFRQYTAEDGPMIWEKLHSYKYSTVENAKAFFDEWMLIVPSFGCSCKAHWAHILIELPPDFSSAENFFKWGVAAHNLVNLRLSKPQFSYKDALVKYGQDLRID